MNSAVQDDSNSVLVNGLDNDLHVKNVVIIPQVSRLDVSWTNADLEELEKNLVELAQEDSVESRWSESGDGNISPNTTDNGIGPSKIARVVTPRVVKNDIRRFFSKMFMNTVNSADFHRTEDFFRTFMTSHCTFVSQQVLAPQFRVPHALHAVGPRLFAHYLLGCFVMYPDMALSMTDTKIITSNTWKGTKIVMQVEYKLTKTCDIPLDCWVPPMQALGRVYAATSIEEMMQTMHITPRRKPVSPTSVGELAPKVPRKRGRPPQEEHRNQPRTYIPETFVKHLQDGAVNLPVPCKLHVKGEFVLFLDENHQIQRAVLNGTQLN